MREAIGTLTRRRRWIWPLLGILLLWAALVVLTDRFSVYSLSGVATSAAFLLLPALGQMLVITTGRGNIDLSLPSVVTLSAYLTIAVSGGRDAGVLPAFAAVLACGLVVGTCNALTVLVLRIPAMIATLASGYILATATLVLNGVIRAAGSAPSLVSATSGRLGPLPYIAIGAVLVAAACAVMLSFSSWGRKLAAVGQNPEAARLSGIKTRRVDASAFIASSILASLTGFLLSGYAGDAFLEMGAPYLLQSVGAVVLGGTLISGGAATTLGTAMGAFLLVMIVTTMQIAGLPVQDILQGTAIIAVLSLAGNRTQLRGR
ncbi:ABC transporter permease [Aureimonas sp. SA4125]|uniref:ABC transporter permease n=1 Tax=Aureimonas sp. SA4125 TaxID=2826993 RepID=UPI001CC41A54|nr:ABC transporter permease [Aureimonas sp. SA4125]BDA85737.1 ABC transporter permease [Aureimonas sp. SA4125]